MRPIRLLAASTVAAMTLATLAAPVEAQGRQSTPADTSASRKSATVVPGSYDSPPMGTSILGKGWRDVWRVPVTVPVLDLDTYAGGLKIDKRGGGFQTVTLHMTEKDGWKEYRFRSVNKYPMQRLPNSLKGTFAGRVIQDQTASLFPGAPLVAQPFVAAVGGLHVIPKLYVMPDDPRLGEHRSTFAGMLGTMELKGEEAPDDKPGFAGSSKIKGTENFFEDLSQSRVHRLDEREFLAVRLVDFLINDGDRTPDNFDWARFGEKGAYTWRPIARDRDRAFTDARGMLNQYLVRKVYPKFTKFGETYSLKGLTASSYIFDRRLLQRLTRNDFAEIAGNVQRAISDTVIGTAIATLPPEWRQQTTEDERIRATLIARREGLGDFAMRFYDYLAGEPDIHLTNDDERADIVRHEDGRVTVTVADRPRPVVVATSPETPTPGGGATRVMGGDVAATSAPFYQRTFLPSETNEVRVYLGKGNDTAVVRGAKNGSIVIRVVGDSGADVLADSVGGGATYFYDSEGANRFILADGTHVSETPWLQPEHVFGFAPGSAWRPDWGTSRGWSPVVKHKQGAGLILGVGPRYRAYGFRRLPHWWEAKAAFLVGTGNGRVGVTGEMDYRNENSPLALTFAGRASQLEAFRFFGYGNNTPYIGSELSLVEQTVLAAEPAVVWHIGWRSRENRGGLLQQDSAGNAKGMRTMIGRLYGGPVIAWTNPDPMQGSPLTTAVEGGDSFAEFGAKVGIDLNATDRDAVPTRGWALRANVTGYPAAFGMTTAFSTATATGATYVPLGFRDAHLALRLGGSVANGDFPAQYAARIGGSSTVRGYRSGRYAGDAAASGTTELRMPVGSLNFIVRSQVGVFGLADVGRVWYDGVSDGDWHRGVGGGVWLSALGRVVSLSYAKGEHHRFYLKGGMGF